MTLGGQRDAWRAMGAAGAFGFTMVACTYGGWIIGHELDYWFHTSPMFAVALLLVGCFAGFAHVLVYYKDTLRRGGGK